ncbi:hypothetical protein [Prosthecobacter dejongeii]|uniref:Uncharacterized protein n=1 Tax=Prosthecobacter dejongeii TaxID=48465 RepID=A0A7W8DQS3_9BACT|nr:hypothetical protein [Prosthecobacter dejongeii]MBB5038642.1 hypothetical protein [Prosthecobacter dejongeii]
MNIPEDPEILWRAMNVAALTVGPLDILARPTVGFTPEERAANAAHNQEMADKALIRYEERLVLTAKAVLKVFMTLKKGGPL